jgi:uncharacterized protein (UPF0254 family)
MRPVVVMGFEMDAMEYMVCGVAGIMLSRLAQPKASSQMISPSWATATDIEGMSPLAMASRIVVRTGPKVGFGTVADVGTCPLAALVEDNRRHAVTAASHRALFIFFISDSHENIRKGDGLVLRLQGVGAEGFRRRM